MAKQWRRVCRQTGLLIPAVLTATWKARLSERGVTALKDVSRLGNSHTGGRATFHQLRKVASRCGESSASRSRRPLPCSTRMRMRWLAMVAGAGATADFFTTSTSVSSRIPA